MADEMDSVGSDAAKSEVAKSDGADDPAEGARGRDAGDHGMPDNGVQTDPPGEARVGDAMDVPSFPVVGVGASAGGLQAFRQLLRAMGAAPGVALVYIQHLSPDHESMIASILAKDTEMPVVEAGNAMRIERDHVYVIPPGKFLTVADHGLFLEPPIMRDGLRMPIDHFLSSLGGQLGNRAIGIILSGTGTDGAIGAREVKAAGGLMIVQQPEHAEYDGMPRAAIGTGTADMVVPITEMPDRIAAYLAHPYARGEAPASGAVNGTSPDAIAAIVRLLSAHTDHDFSSYRHGTLGRRVMRRMSLRRLTDPRDYLAVLRAEPDELRALFADLLIGVTRFFRDPEAWRVLQTEIIPGLVSAAREERRPLRAWVAGCSTGEEAYSLAILLTEAYGTDDDLDFQIFATDLNERAIATARAGWYPPNIADDVTAERLERHFHEHEGQLRLNKSIRERIVFAPQNVLRDPPFLRTDLVTCRNLLIYLDAKVQGRVLDTFGFSLRRGGALFLGASEGAAAGRRGLEAVSTKWRIYRKLSGASGVIPIAERRPAAAEWTAPANGRGTDETPTLVAAAQAALLARHVPASLVMSADGTALYFAGPVGRFLTVQPGRPTASALEMAPPELRSRLRSAVHQARAREERVTLVAPRVPLPEGPRTVTIEAEALEGSDGPFLISMTAEAEREVLTPPDGSVDPRDEAIAQLEDELRAVRDDLQSSIEELETTNEELKASNEEATSVNEEMQSANEELETSREELQSMNEELSTVNAQLEDKIDEMEGLFDDLSNLLRSTDLAVLFLDNDLAIRRFTPAATDLLNVMDADIGRPAAHLAIAREDEALLDDAVEVSRDLTPVRREVRLGSSWFERVIRPFRTSENRIDGVVVVFVDVTESRRTLDALARRERQANALAELGRRTVTDGLERFMREACETLKSTLEADFAKVLRHDPERDEFVLVAGVGWPDGTMGARVPGHRASQAGFTYKVASPVVVRDLREETRFDGPTLLLDNAVRSGLSCMIGPEGGSFGVLGVHSREQDHFAEDDAAFLESVATLVMAAVRNKEAMDELASRERTLRLATEAASMGAFSFDPETDAATIDPVIYRLFDIEPGASITGARLLERVVEEDREVTTAAVARAMRGEAPYRAEFRVRHRDGAVRWIAGHGDAADTEGERRLFGVNFDITERKAMEERQRYTAGELDHRVKNVLATVSSIVSIAGRTATNFETFQRSFSDRVQSLARTHTRLADAKWSGLVLRELIEDELAAYRAGGTRFALSGPAIQLSPVQTQPLALALHELTTNAVKHGAIRHRGAIDVTWTLDETDKDRTLRLDWRESGAGPVAEPERHGFGWSVIHGMMEHQLNAEVRTEYGPDGLHLSYRIPLPGTVETLAAGAAMPASADASLERPITPAGSGEGGVKLVGRRVLLLDDEYLVVMQLAASLRRRGAEVVGPAFRLDEAERLASENAIDLAILDYNVGGKSVAPFADALASRGTPFVIATGYGDHVELDGASGDAPRIRKPVEDGALDSAIRTALGAA